VPREPADGRNADHEHSLTHEAKGIHPFPETYNSLFFAEGDSFRRRPIVHVLIPVHNRMDATLECVACLERQTYRDFRVVIVDDGSTDGTSDTLERMHPEVEVLRGDGNLWWTGAVHMGVEHILKSAKGGDFVLTHDGPHIDYTTCHIWPQN
jgi:cellulose synthase/poly-beta-1,6-N-acetylglucosamine synthase-like glycosyltransferase